MNRCRPTLAASVALACLALAGCTISLGSGTPSSDPPTSPPATSAEPTTATEPTTSASPSSSALDPSETPTTSGLPSVPIPTLVVPSTSAKPNAELRTSTRALRGRSGTASWEITIPTFAGKPVASEVNRRVEAAANDLIARVKREARGHGGARRTLGGRGRVVTNDGRTAQVTIVFVDYVAGAAHPSDYVTTTVVDVKKSWPVLFSQVVQNPPEAMRFLKTEVIKLARAKGEDVTEPGGLSAKLSNWAAWQSTTTGMIFLFEDYQLGGLGLRSYTMPWPRAKLVLSAYGEKLLLPR